MNTRLLLLLLLFSKLNNNTYTQSLPNHLPKSIVKRENIKNLYKAEDGKIILTSNFTYPFIINTSNPNFEQLVNTYFENKVNEMKDYEKDSYLSAKNFYESFPETSLLPYTMEVNFSTEYNSDKLLSFKLLSNSYLGGAHSNPMTKGVTFDSVNNNVITFDKMYVDDTKTVNSTLNYLIEEYIEDNNMQDSLFPYEKGSLPLPYKDNFFITKTGVTYIYNPYEIAPYATGIIFISIPYIKLANILSYNFKTLVL